jgi:transposase
MATALSMDLRLRVLAAIDAGASCRQAAARFGVSPASAIRWAQLQRRQGDVCPRQQGGDRRSQRTEAHAKAILKALEKKRDSTLAELRAALAEQGISLGQTTLWRFFVRHRITLKKRPRMPPSRIGPTC